MFRFTSISLLPADQHIGLPFLLLSIVSFIFTLIMVLFYGVSQNYIKDKKGYEEAVTALKEKYRKLEDAIPKPNYQQMGKKDLKNFDKLMALLSKEEKERARIGTTYRGKWPKRYFLASLLVGVIGVMFSITATSILMTQDNIHNTQMRKSWAATASVWAAKNYNVVSGMSEMRAQAGDADGTAGNVIIRNAEGLRYEVYANLVIVGRTYVLVGHNGQLLPRPASAPKFKTTTNYYDNPSNVTVFFGTPNPSDISYTNLFDSIFGTNLTSDVCLTSGSHCKADRYATIKFLVKKYDIRDADASVYRTSPTIYQVHAITKYGELVTGRIIMIGDQRVFIDPNTNAEYNPAKPWAANN